MWSVCSLCLLLIVFVGVGLLFIIAWILGKLNSTINLQMSSKWRVVKRAVATPGKQKPSQSRFKKLIYSCHIMIFKVLISYLVQNVLTLAEWKFIKLNALNARRFFERVLFPEFLVSLCNNRSTKTIISALSQNEHIKLNCKYVINVPLLLLILFEIKCLVRFRIIYLSTN